MNKELIRDEIKKLQDIFVETAQGMETEDEATVYSMCAVEFGDELLSFLDTLPDEPVSDDLEEAAENSWAVYEYRESPKGLYSTCYVDGFIAGAEWARKQMSLPEDTLIFQKGVEEGKRLMMEEWLKDRDGCFWDGVEEGKKAMEKQMLEGAVEGEVVKDINNKLAVTAKRINLDGFKFGDKVKVIIVKED